jgi:hypothetical protein
MRDAAGHRCRNRFYQWAPAPLTRVLLLPASRALPLHPRPAHYLIGTVATSNDVNHRSRSYSVPANLHLLPAGPSGLASRVVTSSPALTRPCLSCYDHNTTHIRRRIATPADTDFLGVLSSRGGVQAGRRCGSAASTRPGLGLGLGLQDASAEVVARIDRWATNARQSTRDPRWAEEVRRGDGRVGTGSWVLCWPVLLHWI